MTRATLPDVPLCHPFSLPSAWSSGIQLRTNPSVWLPSSSKVKRVGGRARVINDEDGVQRGVGEISSYTDRMVELYRTVYW